MVKNEADVIELVVHHHLAQGLDALLIADNGSTDGTREMLRAMSLELPVYVATDTMTAFYQAEKMTLLASAARIAGAAFIVPFDADEFWYAQESSVADHLRHSRFDVISARLHNLFPVADLGDRVDPSHLFRLDLHPHRLGKVAYRSYRGSSLHVGNHEVYRPGTRGPGLFVAHVPWRSWAQFRRKVSQGAEAVSQTAMPELVAAHWRHLEMQSETELERLWAALLTGEQVQLGWSPHGPFERRRVLEWSQWLLGEDAAPHESDAESV